MIKQYFSENYVTYTNFVPTDIYPVQYGEEQCKSSHSFGPCMRNNYLIHYVYSGKGIFNNGKQEYIIGKGQMFLICPNQITYYKADFEDPWLYGWIEFNGSMAAQVLKLAGLGEDTPIKDDYWELSVGEALHNIVLGKEMRFELMMQKFWAFIYSLTKDSENISVSPVEEYIKKAEIYIKTNIPKKITVNNIAAYIGIDRSYLCRLFKEYKGISPQQYILAMKMNTAARYLKNSALSVTEAAQSVGYSDTHTFNKAFKRIFKCSPSAWKSDNQTP